MCSFHTYLQAYPALVRARRDGLIDDERWTHLRRLPDFDRWLSDAATSLFGATTRTILNGAAHQHASGATDG